jgi:hypothetical protein
MGGTYEYWTVNSGVLTIGQTIGTPIICSPSGVDNFMDENIASIYPNPSNGKFTIVMPLANATITVTDILGRVKIETQQKQQTGNFQLNENGVFIVYISTKQVTTAQKLIINR